VRYLLDTDVVSELRKGPGRADPRVVAWAAAHPASDLFISVITVLEIELGVARVERGDPARGVVLRAWFERAILTDLADRTLPLTLDGVRLAVSLHVPDPRPDRDAFIAATALEHGLTVVTGNTAGYCATGGRVLNPWVDR